MDEDVMEGLGGWELRRSLGVPRHFGAYGHVELTTWNKDSRTEVYNNNN